MDIEVLKNIVEQNPIGTLILHREDPSDIKSLRIKMVNKASEEAIGVNSKKITGKLMYDVFPAVFEQYPNLLAAYMRALEGTETDLGEIEYGDENVISSYFLTRIYPVGENYIMVTYDNVTKKRLAQEALRNMEKKIVNSIIYEQELDRETFAENIHEGLAQTLSGLTFHIKNIETKIQSLQDDSLLEDIDYIKRYIHESIEHSRKLATSIMPREMMSYGLVPSIEQYIENVKTSDFKIVFKNNFHNEEVKKQIEITVYRAVESILNMIGKSSQSEVVVIELSDKPLINLGIKFRQRSGLSPENKKELESIRKRVELQKGNLIMGSDPNKSAFIKIKF